MTKDDILLETGTNELEILEFFIKEKTSENDAEIPCYFGVNVAKVMQVIESPNLEANESAVNPCFLGTIPLRDLVLPVLDLSIWLGMNKKESDFDVVIVTEFSKAVNGFLVSGVTEIHRVGWEEVEPPDTYTSKMGSPCIVGLVNRGDHFIQILDLEQILDDLKPDDEDEVLEMVVADREYKALVADDSSTIRQMLQDHLENAKFSYHIVKNGKEALDYLMDAKAMVEQGQGQLNDFVDIVISDIEMPLMDGFSMTKKLKEDKILKELPVILYSSIITNELKHKGQSVGADDQIPKPDLNRVASRALELIRQKQEQKA